MSEVQTLYGPLNSNIIYKFGKAKLLALDVDGVFSNGNIFMGNNGEELKAFNTLDGYGIKSMLSIGIQVAIITGRNSKIVEDRMSSLGVSLIIQGQEDKREAVKKLREHFELKKEQVVSMGDDMPDLGMFMESSMGVSVPNGHPYVKNQAEYVTRTKGGEGAVRELCDLILLANNKLNQLYGSSV